MNVNSFRHTLGKGYPIGVLSTSKGYQFTCVCDCKRTLYLEVYNDAGLVMDRVNMLLFKVSEDIASVIINGLSGNDFSYSFLVDDELIDDVTRKNSTAKRAFGDKSLRLDSSKIYVNGYNWEGDKILNLAFKDICAYQLNVRSFTMHSSSKVKNKGTFKGIIEKIPYFNLLGVNQLILMPVYDFDEVERPRKNNIPTLADYTLKLDDEETLKVNLWGFKRGAYYMPKASFSASGDPVNEFKDMVKALHKAGIEVILRFYFPDNVNRSIISDLLKFWVYEYHVDGFFLMGNNLPIEILSSDIYLRSTKLYCVFFDKNALTNKPYGYNRKMAFVNDDFMNVCRRFLKSDENMLNDFVYRQRLNPTDVHVINYITNFEGFTLNDLVSYDYKHNEANGENNRDGENFNFSWNCGTEGESRKRNILCLRMKQIKNAFTFLFMAQGVPMLNAGDEFLNTQEGNNNPYCQDNETGWVVWKDNKRSREVFEFVKSLIALRKSHPILHPEAEFRIMDYAACGFPDLSYHSENAWGPRFDNHLRNIGVMLCGKYARLDRVTEDDFFYICYNMHWEYHDFGLPKLPKGLKWKLEYYTCDDILGKVIADSLLKGNESVKVTDRTVALLRSCKAFEGTDFAGQKSIEADLNPQGTLYDDENKKDDAKKASDDKKKISEKRK